MGEADVDEEFGSGCGHSCGLGDFEGFGKRWILLFLMFEMYSQNLAGEYFPLFLEGFKYSSCRMALFQIL